MAEVMNWFLLFFLLFYLVVSILSIRWIVRHDIMDNFQKTMHIILSLVLPVLWFYLIRMIYKPTPGYKKRRGFDSGTDGDSGGNDYGVSMAGDGGGDGGGD